MFASVVISNYNYQRFVMDAIDSCLRQRPKVELIVVDDASTDKSWPIISKKAQRYGFIAIRLSKNSGGNARGKNVGIALAKSEFITCLDADDMLLPDSINTRLRRIQELGVDWVHGKAVRIETNVNYDAVMKMLRNKARWKSADVYETSILSKPETDICWYRGIEASTVLARRSVYERVGLYDEDLRWKIDREMWYRLLMHGVPKAFLSDCFVSVYRRHPWQVTKNRKVKQPEVVNKKFKKIVAERQILNKHNTLWLDNYQASSYIGEVVGAEL
jgi:glycosyltransferase involved in cell wall biosynthesis